MATYIIYPEKKWVLDTTIHMWYDDAVANHEIAEEYLYAHDIETMKRALSDAGIITYTND